MLDKFVLGVVSWLLIGAVAIAVGILGILHVIFHDALPAVLLVAGGVVATATALFASVRGRPSNYPR